MPRKRFAELHERPQFDTKVLHWPPDKPRRLIAEALLIKQKQPKLNLKFEGGESQNINLYIGLTESQRQEHVAHQRQLRQSRKKAAE